jgi:phosphoglycolate phosphatase
MKDIQSVIWDWNGTLLDDTLLCLDTINQLLDERNLTTIDETKYKQLFNFPVKDFYIQLGFDFERESFEDLSVQYMRIYMDGLKKAPLAYTATYALKRVRKKGKLQYILSAMEKPDLVDSLITKGIKSYFSKIYGNTNKLGNGKISIGKSLIENEQLIAKDTLLVGDTIHDYEVAQELGCQVILVSSGHQDSKRLKALGVPVVQGLDELMVNYF